MKTADVVIGANFGDEGKGLITDYLAASYGQDALVVRFNGGAQAGHTVVTPEGRRHVFGHLGSGSFVGAPTFLSRFFVCNPMLFLKEHQLLRDKGASPTVYVDTRALVTTPYDMMINQIAEDARGNGRHGSCGVGFGETIERNLRPEFALSYAVLENRDELARTLRAIRETWLPQRLHTLGIHSISEIWQARVQAEGIIEKYLDDVSLFLQMTLPAQPDFLHRARQKVIFEGGQGLLLDQDYGWFPHVTRSHTGLRNVLALAEDAGLDGISVNYVTRAYATRHGAGPLPHELGCLPYPQVKDETNFTNAYQGSLRFAWLDVDLLSATIRKDLARNPTSLPLNFGLAVTCMDQVEGKVNFIRHGVKQSASPEEFLQLLKNDIHHQFLHVSHGACRKDVAEWRGASVQAFAS